MNQIDQMVALYETGASPDVIAKAMDLSPDVVTTALYEGSAKFRRAASPVDMSKPVADQMLDIMVDVARNSDNGFLRLASARTVRDDLLGRRDAVQVDSGGVIAAISALGARFAELDKRRREFNEGRTITVS
jgi:hypothetical protein